MKFNDFLNEQLKNEELRKEYDKLTPEYEIISAIIKARNEKGLTQLELAKTIGTD
ncbi:MAG: helix-turn-helix domain-containing protein [Cetobacterium sp.]